VAETKKLKDETVVLRIPKESQVQELVDLLGLGMKNNLKIIIATTDK
jgi:biopolymer transport protein ExbD